METTLEQYVKLHGQTETARRVGLTQGAIWQMLASSRQIMVVEGDDVHLEERKIIKKSQVSQC